MKTFHEILEGFLHYSEAKASYLVYRRICDQHFVPWTTHPTFLQIEDWHASLKSKPHHANKGLSFLKAMYNWAIRREHYVGHNPAVGVRRHRTYERERVMSTDEVALLLNCLDMVPQKLSTMLIVLLTTGCRLSEAREMQRQHVNMVTGKWLQPKTKNGKPHETYLPQQARTALARLTPNGDYLFAGAYDHCWSRAGVEKVWRQVRGTFRLQDVRLHDFRRTLSTHMYRATKDYSLVQRCINHHKRSVTDIYVRVMLEEVSAALQAQADRFFSLAVRPVPVMQPLTHDYKRRASDVLVEA